MDIVKQISIMLWLLVIVLITPLVLRHFNVDVKTLYRKVLFLPEDTNAERDALASQHQEINSADFDVLFHTEQETPQERKTAEQEYKKLVNELKKAGEQVVSSTDSQVQEVPSLFRIPQGADHKVRWLPPPPGFMTADTFNYLIYRQDQPVGDKLKSLLDTIHGNLMLDLTPFTLVQKPNRILVMLFENRQSYMSFTKRPSWSGAASDLQTDTMYVLEGPNLYPLTVHELTHLYFDGYFLPTISPLWLSEGMAVYMQIYVTKRKPSWLDAGIDGILDGHYIPLEDMMNMEDLSSLNTQQAQLWYTQAYTLVEYMLTQHSRDEFYRFCNELKAKSPVYQALYRAYGMPFTKVSVLQNVWLHDLAKRFGPTFQPEAGSNADKISPQALSSTQTIKVPVMQSYQPPQQQQPQRTVIKKLQMVPTNSYQGNF